MRPDYAVHEVIAMWQDRVLFAVALAADLAAAARLRARSAGGPGRLHDGRIAVAAHVGDLLPRSTRCRRGNTATASRPSASLRRNLQRLYLKRLSAIALRSEINLPVGPVDFSNFAFLQGSIPEDCQTVAYAELVGLHDKIKKVIDNNPKLDAYSRAHLLETSERIQKVVDARLVTTRP